MVQFKLVLKFENVQTGFYGGQRMEGFMYNMVAQLGMLAMCSQDCLAFGPDAIWAQFD
jgi:hypothetical protein